MNRTAIAIVSAVLSLGIEMASGLLARGSSAAPTTLRAPPVKMPLSYRSGAYGYSLTLPPGWTARSREEIEQEIGKWVTAESDEHPNFDAVFFNGDPAWPDAQVRVQIVRYRTKSEPSLREMKTIMQRFVHDRPTTRELTAAAQRRATRTETTEPQFDDQTRIFTFDQMVGDPIAGPVRQHFVGHFGHTALVVVRTAAPQEKYRQFEGDFADIHKSFRFDMDTAYRGHWETIRTLIIIFIVALIAIAWLVRRYTRRPSAQRDGGGD